MSGYCRVLCQLNLVVRPVPHMASTQTESKAQTWHIRLPSHTNTMTQQLSRDYWYLSKPLQTYSKNSFKNYDSPRNINRAFKCGVCFGLDEDRHGNLLRQHNNTLLKLSTRESHTLKVSTALRKPSSPTDTQLNVTKQVVPLTLIHTHTTAGL